MSGEPMGQGVDEQERYMMTFMATPDDETVVATSNGEDAEDALLKYVSASGRDLRRVYDRIIVVTPMEGSWQHRAFMTSVFTVRKPEPTPQFVVERVVLD